MIDDLLNSFNLTLNSDLTINMDNYSLENLIKKFKVIFMNKSKMIF